jgi:hypothetical protein
MLTVSFFLSDHCGSDPCSDLGGCAKSLDLTNTLLFSGIMLPPTSLPGSTRDNARSECECVCVWVCVYVCVCPVPPLAFHTPGRVTSHSTLKQRMNQRNLINERLVRVREGGAWICRFEGSIRLADLCTFQEDSCYTTAGRMNSSSATQNARGAECSSTVSTFTSLCNET